MISLTLPPATECDTECSQRAASFWWLQSTKKSDDTKNTHTWRHRDSTYRLWSNGGFEKRGHKYEDKSIVHSSLNAPILKEKFIRLNWTNPKKKG